VIGVGCARPFSRTYAESIKGNTIRFLRWADAAGCSSVANVTPATVRAYLEELLATRAVGKRSLRSPNTCYRILMQVRAFCKWAVVQELMPADATAGTKGPSRVYAFIEPLDDNQLVAVLQACGVGRSELLGTRNECLVHMLAFTGLRALELESLNRADLEGKDIVKVTGKGGWQRSVGLHPAVQASLDRYFQLRTDSSPAAFVDQDGRRMAHTAVRSVLHRIGRQVGIPKLGTHTLRRTAFTNMARAGFSAFELHAIGGWSTFVAAWQYIRRGAEASALDKHREFDPQVVAGGAS